MPGFFYFLLAIISMPTLALAEEPPCTSLHVMNRDIPLPLEAFRPDSAQQRVLARRDQLIRLHTGAAGMTIRPIMSPVKDQGNRGTCNVFAATALLEAFTDEDYSEQWLARQSSDKDPGYVVERLDFVRRNGICLEQDCRYDPIHRENMPDVSRAKRIRFDAAYEVYPFAVLVDPIAYIKSRLAVSSPVAVSIYVVGEKQWARGPFIYPPSNETIQAELNQRKVAGDEGAKNSFGTHAVVVTGVNDIVQLIEFKNSWGTDWGKNGYGYMSYDYFLTYGTGGMVSY